MTPPFDPFASLVSQLSRSARAAYPFIRGLAVSQPNLKATAIYDQLVEAGFPLRKQTTLDIVALLRNRGDLVRFERTFGSSAIIPDALHTLSPPGFKKGARVAYLVSLKSDNPLLPDAVYVTSRSNLSINQIIGGTLAILAGDSFGPGADYQADQVSQMTIEEARYAPGQQASGEFPPPEL
jgi:hypothetical protein